MLLPSPFVLNKFSLWARPEDPHWASGPGRASVTTAYTKNPYIHVYIYIYTCIYIYIYLYIGWFGHGETCLIIYIYICIYTYILNKKR